MSGALDISPHYRACEFEPRSGLDGRALDWFHDALVSASFGDWSEALSAYEGALASYLL